MKAAIYLRVSTTDQDPELQKKACEEFAMNRGYEVDQIFMEELSGFKTDVERPMYERIKELARAGKIKAVIVWALDRWVRNRETLLNDIVILRGYGCKIHSVQEAWLEAINIEGPLGKTIQDFLLGLIGSLAEMESQRKSERIKMAFENHKGDKWGRPEVKEKTRLEVVNLWKEGKSMRQISQVVTYWDKSRHLKNISIGAVHKIITDHKRAKSSHSPNSASIPFLNTSRKVKGGGPNGQRATIH